jgi:chromosome segregation ATPase
MQKPITVPGAKTLLMAGAAAFGLSLTATAATAGDMSNISIDMDSFDLDIGDEDFLEQLIEMDAEDIAELRADMAEARGDIREAIGEIEEARREAESSPESKAIIATALAAASESVSESTKGVFDQVRSELDRAERELKDGKADISAEEFAETTEVIAALRDELSGVELALGELIDAMKA